MRRRDCCIAAAGFAATGVSPTPAQAFAKACGIVHSIKDAAAAAPMIVHPLRGKVSVLKGWGGNIAVLTDRDGNLLVDCGISVSRPQITGALADFGAEPVTRIGPALFPKFVTDGVSGTSPHRRGRGRGIG